MKSERNGNDKSNLKTPKFWLLKHSRNWYKKIEVFKKIIRQIANINNLVKIKKGRSNDPNKKNIHFYIKVVYNINLNN